MTILTYDEIRRLVREVMDQYTPVPAVVPVPAIVPIPDEEPTPGSSDDDDDDDDDELPPLAPAPAELTLLIPLIPSFPKAVKDAFNPSYVADDVDDPLQLAVTALQTRLTPSCCAPCTCLLCAPCALTGIYTDTVVGSFSAVFSSVSWRFRDTG
jgi:hypothetical protein